MTPFETQELPKPRLMPCCGYAVEAALSINGERAPAPGDVTVCASCVAVCVVGDDGFDRRATQAEIAGIRDRDPEAAALLALVRLSLLALPDRPAPSTGGSA